MNLLGLHGAAAGLTVAGIALVVALAGRWIARRWRLGLPAVCAAASLVGWALLGLAGWREVLWPRTVFDHVYLPAAILIVAGIIGERVRTRWLGVGCALFAACWLAGAGVARPEFWRVVFGGLGVAALLNWSRGFEASRALAVGLSMLGGMIIGGAGWLWVGASLVLVMMALGMVGAGARVVSPVLLMVGLVAAELGAGRLIRGGVGVVDLTLIGALGAPLAAGLGERAAARRFKRLAGLVGPVAAAVGVVAVAWVTYRVARSY